jgi:hypothetical protein
MRINVGKASLYGFGLLMLAGSIGTRLHAAAVCIVPAPEIDGSTLVTGLGLLTAGILIVRARRQSK